jgi:cytochrome c-type biogenesis protein CcmH/NrfG
MKQATYFLAPLLALSLALFLALPGVSLAQAAPTAGPPSVESELKLAGQQLSNNDFAACIPSYQHIIGLDPGSVRAWLGLGFAYLHTGKNSLSMAAFAEAMRLDPSKKAALQPLLAKLQSP